MSGDDLKDCVNEVENLCVERFGSVIICNALWLNVFKDKSIFGDLKVAEKLVMTIELLWKINF